MKKSIVLLLLIFTSIIIFSIPGPRKNKEVGAIVGQVSIQGTSSWTLTVYVKDNKTGKNYIIKPKKEGYYYLLNLNPGTYILYKIGLSKSDTYSYSWASDLELRDKGIEFVVKPNRIISINHLIIYLQVSGRRVRYGFNIDITNFDEYLNNLKSYFERIDRRGLWKDFEWNE